MGSLISLEMQIVQLLFSCASSYFLNDIVYATWHVSSARCCSVAPMHLSHRAVGLWDIVAAKVHCRILRLSGAGCSDCCRESETSSVRRAAFDLRPGGLLVYNCVNNLLHFTRVLNIIISFSPVLRISCVCVYNRLCYSYVYIP